jgi:transaldolase/glucose-6-phosphate isomerase
VQLAKDLAKQAMSEASGGKTNKQKDNITVGDKDRLRNAVDSWLGKKKPRDYIAVHAYIDPSPENATHLQALCTAIQQRVALATTLGFGPRFLHSTGQLHKGGANSVMVLQIIDQPADNLSVPETNYTFDALIQAQAWGDFTALKQRRRRVLRVDLGSDDSAGLSLLTEAVRGD